MLDMVMKMVPKKQLESIGKQAVQNIPMFLSSIYDEWDKEYSKELKVGETLGYNTVRTKVGLLVFPMVMDAKTMKSVRTLEPFALKSKLDKIDISANIELFKNMK